MPLVNYKTANNAQGVLLTGISASATALILATGQGGLFPSTFPFPIELKEVDTAVNNYRVLKREIATCTGRAGDTLTITRATEPCPSDYTSVTQTTTAFAFSVPASTIVTASLTGFAYNDLRDEIVTKLPTIGGLRTGMGASLQATEIDATGAEVKKAISIGTSIGSTDIIQTIEPSTRARKEIAYSILKADIASAVGQSRSYIAGEGVSLNDFLLEEGQYLYGFIANSTSVDNKIGDIAADTRIALRIIGNGISASNLKLSVKKFGAPLDNRIVRIETDNGSGLPSGTLANANATSTVAGTADTTSYVDTTITFAGAFTLTDGVVYHIVISRSGAIDPTNYYSIQGISKNTRSFQFSLYNASYGAYTGTNMIYVSYLGAYSIVGVKTNALYVDTMNYVGIAGATKTIGQSVLVAISGIQSAFTGLTTNAAYYLSNTPGAISTTPGTTIVPVGDAINATTIFVKNLPKLAQDFNYTSVNAAASTGGPYYSGILENKRKVYSYSASANQSTLGSSTVSLQVSNDGVTFTNYHTLNSPYNSSVTIAFIGELPGKYFRLTATSGNSAAASASLI